MHSSLLDVIPKSRVRRQRIMEFIIFLRENPHLHGDYTDRDDSQRERQIKIVGDHAITFWFDAPASVVMTVDIRAAND